LTLFRADDIVTAEAVKTWITITGKMVQINPKKNMLRVFFLVSGNFWEIY